MPEYVVKDGDCIASIAEKNGFFRWESIYYHEDNAELRKTRPDPNQLKTGDKVMIPEFDDREEICATGRDHVFQLREKPMTEIHLQMEVQGRLLANMKFELTYTQEGAEKTRKGYTNREGEILHRLPAEVAAATLKIWDSKAPEAPPFTWDLKIGDLDPITESSGIQDRLRNLGYDLGDEDGEIGEKTQAALKDFQANEGLEVTGSVDDATKKALDEKSIEARG